MRYEVERKGYKMPRDRFVFVVKNRRGVAAALIEKLKTQFPWMAFSVDKDDHDGLKLIAHSFDTKETWSFGVYKTEGEE